MTDSQTCQFGKYCEVRSWSTLNIESGYLGVIAGTQG